MLTQNKGGKLKWNWPISLLQTSGKLDWLLLLETAKTVLLFLLQRQIFKVNTCKCFSYNNFELLCCCKFSVWRSFSGFVLDSKVPVEGNLKPTSYNSTGLNRTLTSATSNTSGSWNGETESQASSYQPTSESIKFTELDIRLSTCRLHPEV